MHLSRRFRQHRHAKALEAIARSFLPDFPELEGLDFELDLLPSRTWILGLAETERNPPRIRLRPARPTNNSLTYTIPHEFTHLLQEPLGLVPQGERSCDVYAMARTGERWHIPPTYLREPRDTWEEWDRWAGTAAELARQALRQRDRGRRQYIVWWEKRFRDHVRALGTDDSEQPWESVWSAAIEGGSTEGIMPVA